MTKLTIVEASSLQQNEKIIEAGLNTFVDVGNALAAIRDSKLYKEYGTFEEYCQDRWGITRQYASYQIQAASVVTNLSTIVDKIPATESQARPLASLTPEQQQEVWQGAVDTAPDGKVTAKHVKDVVSKAKKKMDVHYSSKTDEWSTPQDLFDVLDSEFGFTLDVCAIESSAKCNKYFTPEIDGLSQDWHTDICWMNPPYGSEIVEWVKKAHEVGDAGGLVVCLVPARVDTGWWWNHCIKGEIKFLKGRLKFGEATTSAPFPSAVVIFNGAQPNVEWWDWRNDE